MRKRSQCQRAPLDLSRCCRCMTHCAVLRMPARNIGATLSGGEGDRGQLPWIVGNLKYLCSIYAQENQECATSVTNLVLIDVGWCIRKFPDWPPGRGLQMVQLYASKCFYVAILWVILVSFAVISFCIASQRVFIIIIIIIVVISLWLSPETFGYNLV